MLSKDETTARSVEKVMQDIYNNIGLAYHTYVTTVNNEGVRIVNGE